MLLHHWIQVASFFSAIILLTPLLGHHLAAVFNGKNTFLHPIMGWFERFSYKAAGIDPTQEMSWIDYVKAVIWFNVFGFLFLFCLLLFQNDLPLNPQNFSGTSWPLAFNTSVSFVTNTNWQAYPGETTLSYLTQMLGLTVQNFLSAGTGLAVAFALVRGITRTSSGTIGNFWGDLVRSLAYLYIPFSIILALIFAYEGTVQNLNHYTEVETLEGVKQMIPGGLVASQVAIKQLGTNGGGFFNANSTHPYENPTPLSNWLSMLALVAIPAATIYAYGLVTGSRTHGLVLFAVIFLLWFSGLVVSFYAQTVSNPNLPEQPYVEGIETRVGAANSLIWSTLTTATSNGSVNAMISSLSPLAGGVSLFNIMLGEIIFGGVGVGLCSLIMFVLLTVFLSGLMVGRTPEYMGKKIEKGEMKWVVISLLAPGALILVGAGISVIYPPALESLGNQGPHGLSEILYAFSSAAGNNGSAFAGLNANTTYYNVSLGLVMICARLVVIVPSLSIAGLLALKKTSSPTIGTLSTSSLMFSILLLCVILIIGALTFFPALSLGAIVEHLLMLEGRTF